MSLDNASGMPLADASDMVPEAFDRFALVRVLARVRNAPSNEHEWIDCRIPPGTRRKYAAVLIPLIAREHGPAVLLTQRTEHLNDHAGQISFPGGRVEEHDQHREDTALRETEEEIGLPRSRVQVLGMLPDHEMPSGFCITPVVGWIEPPYPVRLDPFEVQDVFEVPLAHFLDARNYQRRSYLLDGCERRYYAIPHGGRYIWGATAAMLYGLQRALRAGA
jgi:8-oxo-dGTP pyrophosphatase MutT (NUDIX family)